MPPKTKKVKNEKQVFWTLQERFAVWHLLHDNKFALNDQGWRTIWQEIAVKDRDLQTVWDDYTQRNAPSRGAMYRKSIDKRNYTSEEATAYESACAEVHRAAKKHGIKLRARPYKASSRKDKKKNDEDNEDNDKNDDDDEEDNEEDPKVNVATSSRAKPKPKPQTAKQKSETIKQNPETTKQKPGRKRKDAKSKDTPQEKKSAVVKRVAQKQPRNRPNDQSKKEELGQHHEALTETTEDDETDGLLPANDDASSQALEEAAMLSGSQFVSPNSVADRAGANTALTPQKRKLEGSDRALAAASLQNEQGDVEMADSHEEQGSSKESRHTTQQESSLNDATSDTHDQQRLTKKIKSGNPQNTNRQTSLLEIALEGSRRSRMQEQASEQMSTEQSSTAFAKQMVPPSNISNDVEMTTADTEESVESIPAFDKWWQTELNRILLGPAYDLFPKRKQRVVENDEEADLPTTPAQRVVKFFEDMYDGQFPEAFTRYVNQMLGMKDIANPILAIDSHLASIVNEIGKTPRYKLEEVFESAVSPFSNFRLASEVFGERLQMLHTKDVDYSGPANQQLVACAKLGDRHPTPEDYEWVQPHEPAFKRGGRVHKLYVRQQECPILGDNKRWNTAYVCMDVMLCQKDDCEKCSPYGGAPLLTATSLPRVHMRHTAGKVGEEKTTGVFDEPEVKINARYNKDEDGKFVVNLAYGVVPMEFWDGTIQDVVLCDQDSCQGCREAHGALPFPKKE